MAGAAARSTATRRSLIGNEKSSTETGSFGDMVFGFLEEFEESLENSCNSGQCYEDEEEEVDPNAGDVEEKKAYWEYQSQLLKSTLYRTSSIESKIRKDTKEGLKKLSSAGVQCVCKRPVPGGCRDCIRREICERLRYAGHNCVICKSKWRSSPDIPSGEHTYLEVEYTSSSKKGELRVVIELNFQAEFEMARASEAYNRLISILPEVYVGKSERLRDIIKILCGAAKKCMKEKKMHLGPWRKYKYMQAKWLGTCERTTPSAVAPLPESLSKLTKPKASMLTFDLLGNLAGSQCPAIKVV